MTRAEDGHKPTEPTARTDGEARRRDKDAAQRREFQGAIRAAEAAIPLIEPSAEEARNGWTAESLTAYVQEQQAAQSLRVDPHSTMNRQNRRPKRQNDRYRPLRWRG